jgi:ribosomal protein L10
LEKAGNRLMFIKNSLARKALDMRANEKDDEESCVHEMYKDGQIVKVGWEKLSENFRTINGCIFANGNLSEVADLIEEHTLASNG